MRWNNIYINNEDIRTNKTELRWKIKNETQNQRSVGNGIKKILGIGFGGRNNAFSIYYIG